MKAFRRNGWTMPALNLMLLEDQYGICRLPPGAAAQPPATGAFSLLVRTAEETTVVCPLAQVPAGAELDSGWRCFRIVVSTDLSVPGILSSVLQPLAQAGIGIFATSTFSTDYVLVKERDLDRSMGALLAAGHRIDG